MANNFDINKRAIDQFTRNLQRELNRHPITVPVQHGTPGQSFPPAAPMLQSVLDLDEDEIRLLDFVATAESTEETVGIGTVRTLLGEHTAATVIESLIGNGYLRRTPHNYPRYFLTQDGKKAIRAHRRAQARENLLEWLDTFPEGRRPSTTDLPGHADLAPYSEQEKRAAAQFLIEYQLATTYKNWGAEVASVWITELGRECVETPGSISDFLSRGNQSVSNTQNFNISGSNNTVVGTSGDNNQVDVTVETFDLDAVRESIAPIRQARDALHLPAEADALLDTIEESSDRGVVHRAGRELYLFLTATSSGALGGALAVPLARALGIGS